MLRPKMFAILLTCFLCSLKTVLMVSSSEELIVQDPSMWPGHLEPFGSNQLTSKIDEIETWPDPVTFFKIYVDQAKPVLFKGLAKESPAYAKFDDDYFKNAPDADKIIIRAEPEIKENRTKKLFSISMKEFIERYHNEKMYMVYGLPQPYASDVLMPVPLRCQNTRALMRTQTTWFSNGGTKSVLHRDDVDNINCLFRGSKELWMIEYLRNRPFVPIDQLGGYSSIDVEKVNYTAYPELRKVDMYYKAVMEEGDCLFIPFRWFHQVNSFANKDNMNLAVNIWFEHKRGHVPENCTIPESEATIDKYKFEQKGGGNLMDIIEDYLELNEVISIEFFLKMLKREQLFNPSKHKVDGFPQEFRALGMKLFKLLDFNEDEELSEEDLTAMRVEQEKDATLKEAIYTQVDKVEDYFVDEYEMSELSNKSETVLPTDSPVERMKDEF